MTQADDYGHAAPYLEALREDLAKARPPVYFSGHTVTGARWGEYRFRIGPDRSIYVQAPRGRSGRARPWGALWRYKRAGPWPWNYAETRDQVAAAIHRMAEEYWRVRQPRPASRRRT